jgi:hypothetical protein
MKSSQCCWMAPGFVLLALPMLASAQETDE